MISQPRQQPARLRVGSLDPGSDFTETVSDGATLLVITHLSAHLGGTYPDYLYLAVNGTVVQSFVCQGGAIDTNVNEDLWLPLFGRYSDSWSLITGPTVAASYALTGIYWTPSQ